MDANAVIQTLLSTAIVTAGIVWLAKTVFQQLLSRDIENHKNQLQTNQAIASQHMRAEHERELEQLKNQMEILSIEHATRFTKLHEKRLEVLLRLYELLDNLEGYYAQYAEIYRMMESVSQAGIAAQSSDSVRTIVVYMLKVILIYPFYSFKTVAIFVDLFRNSSLPAFKRYFKENRLYLDESLCDRISEFHDHLRSRTSLFSNYTRALNYTMLVTMWSDPRVSRYPFPASPLLRFYSRRATGKSPNEILRDIEQLNLTIEETKSSIEQEFRVLMGVHSR